MHTIGEVARASGVTVRTLHHYDDVGLLRPGGRTASGYRLYDDADLERLQRILCYRELGFALDEIAALLDDPDVDPIDHLRRQHALLTGRIDRLQAMVRALETTMEARAMGIELTPEELFEVFGRDDPTQHAEEAEQRWGDTDAYRESNRRASGYRKADWIAIRDEGEAIERRFAEALTAGEPADGTVAMELAEEHRQHISRWFYECSPQLHRGLGEMYVADPRFAAHYDGRVGGLAAYVRDAVTANAERHAGG
jgi:MerR family transcriptional regulator, thiopeptide resistance regulator